MVESGEFYQNRTLQLPSGQRRKGTASITFGTGLVVTLGLDTLNSQTAEARQRFESMN
jgi:hypothetical protein